MSRRHSTALLAWALGWLVVGACGDEGPERSVRPAPAPVPVATAEVREVTVTGTVWATGTVRPWRRVSPGTKILGRIERVEVEEGEPVERGELLARLESRDLEAAVAQARASVHMAEARLENAAVHHRRMLDLHERASVTDKALEDATATFRVAQAAVEQARADLAAAEVTLSYAEIRAPFAGSVIEKRAETGDMARPGEPLFVLEDLSRVKIAVEVPESDVVGLEPGARASARIDVLGRELAAVVDRVVPSGAPDSRTFSVRLVLDDPGGVTRSGMFTRVRFEREERSAVVVPRGALVERGQLDGVFVVSASEASASGFVTRLRWVRRGEETAAGVEVLSGLGPGEVVVLEPRARLTDGSPVEPAQP